MTPNRAFWKAFHSLVHPLSLLAIVLLLINDHWLRYAHPSWLTGKLGDFTWLVFAPFIAALLFSWLIPRTWTQQTNIVGLLSIGFIGVWFATAKTIPLVHEWTTQTLYAIVGWEGQLRLDVTDLLTLPALLVSWFIWRRANDNKVSLKPLAYVAFGLGILGTLASDTYYTYDTGIVRVGYCDGRLTASTGSIDSGVGYGYANYTFTSTNGGLFWHDSRSFIDEKEFLDCESLNAHDIIKISHSLQLRWTPDDYIEVSSDDGKTWAVENDLHELDHQIRDIYIKYRRKHFEHIISIKSTPINAYYDEQSGNVVFAMGHNGVLVRKPDATYTWVTVGEYGLDSLSTKFQYASYALFLELWLALATIFLVVTTSTIYIRQKTVSTLRKLIIISWIGYVAILLIHPFERVSDITATDVEYSHFISFWMLIIFGIPLSIGATWDILRNFRSVVIPIALAGIGNGALFLFPFILWTQGRIPRYVTAYAFAVFLTLLGLYATRIYLKRILPILEPEKMKRDDPEKEKHPQA